jgi:uncharacterized protein
MPTQIFLGFSPQLQFHNQRKQLQQRPDKKLHNPLEFELHERLIELVSESTWFMSALKAAQHLELASWCIGAGAVRNLVWDNLHGFTTPSSLPDIDLAYFDANNLHAQYDKALEQRLMARLPGFPWEATNQAAVHQWFDAYFGKPVEPFTSLEEAIASWPEYATAVGVTLLKDDTIKVIAPFGLEDLFAMIVRHNPTRATVSMYRERVVQKRFVERWPKVSVALC